MGISQRNQNGDIALLACLICIYMTSLHCAVIPSTTPSPILSQFPYSSVFTCFDTVFPGETFGMIFPPTELSKDYIVNVTGAADTQKANMETFCSKRQNYSACLQSKLRNSTLAIDRIWNLILDADGIDGAFANYCSNITLVTSQFECTLKQVKSVTCNGSIEGALIKFKDMLRTFPVNNSSCRGIKAAMDCRVERQLKPCNVKYGTTMDSLYEGLLSTRCETE